MIKAAAPNQVSDSHHIDDFSQSVCGSIARSREPMRALVEIESGSHGPRYREVYPMHGYFATGVICDTFRSDGIDCFVLRLDRDTRNFIVMHRPDLIQGMSEKERETLFDNWGAPRAGKETFKHLVTKKSVKLLSPHEAQTPGVFPAKPLSPLVRAFRNTVAVSIAVAAGAALAFKQVSKSRRRPPRSRIYNPLSVKRVQTRKP